MTLPHGTPVGYSQGCRYARACPNYGSQTLMTCEEARTRSRWDRGYLARIEAGQLSAEREAFEGEGFARYRRSNAPVWSEFEEDPVLPTPTFDVEVVRTESVRRRSPEAVRARLEEVAGVPVQVIEDRAPVVVVVPLAVLGTPAEEDAWEAAREEYEWPVVADELVKPDGESWRPVAAEDYAPAAGDAGSVRIKHGTRLGYKKGCRLRDRCPGKVAGGESCTEANAAAGRRAYQNRQARLAEAERAARALGAAATALEGPMVDLARDAEVAGLRAENADLREQLLDAEEQLSTLRGRLKALVRELFRDAS